MRPSRGAALHGAVGKLRHGASGGGGSILSAPPAPPARPQRRQRHFLRRGPSSEGSRFPAAAAARTRRWLPESGRRRTWAPAPSRSCRCSWRCSAARVSGDRGHQGTGPRGWDPRDRTAGRDPGTGQPPRRDPPVTPDRWPKGGQRAVPSKAVIVTSGRGGFGEQPRCGKEQTHPDSRNTHGTALPLPGTPEIPAASLGWVREVLKTPWLSPGQDGSTRGVWGGFGGFPSPRSMERLTRR